MIVLNNSYAFFLPDERKAFINALEEVIEGIIERQNATENTDRK